MDNRISDSSSSNHETTAVSNSRAGGALSDRRVVVNESPRLLERGGSSIPLDNGQPIADRQIHAQTSQDINPPNQGENPDDHRSRLRRLRSRIPSLNLQIGERINARSEARASGREVPSFRNALNWRNEMAALEAEQENYRAPSNYNDLRFEQPSEIMTAEDRVDPIGFDQFSTIGEPVAILRNAGEMPDSTRFYEFQDIQAILKGVDPRDPTTRETFAIEDVVRLKVTTQADRV